MHHWGLGFSQCRLRHAHRACGTSRYIPSRLVAFLPCYFPLCLSTPGRVGALEGLLPSTFCPYWAIQRAPRRRTFIGFSSFSELEIEQSRGRFHPAPWNGAGLPASKSILLR